MKINNFKTLHYLFEAQVLKTPNNVAIVSADMQYSYFELSVISNKIANKLLTLNVKPNTLVAIIMEKGWEQVVGILSILKSGAAYLPIEPVESTERITHLLNQGNVDIVLTQSKLEKKLNIFSIKHLLSVDSMLCFTQLNADLPIVQQKSSDLAYVIYTSGSTGVPKGVMITHGNIINTISDINNRFKICETDKIYGLSSFNFDLSVYDIFGSFFSGAAIVLPNKNCIKDPSHWVEQLLAEKITVWNSVPIYFQMLVEHLNNVGKKNNLLNLQSLRLVLLSGDWIPVSLPAKTKKIFKNIEIISLGGATEAGIWSIIYPIGKVDPNWNSIPYGKPMKNQSFYIYDKNLNDIKKGEIGELYIGGLSVAKGYWKDEALTREKFIIHPQTHEYLYKTGDLGRYLPDDNIEFLGRVDQQIKIGGHRVDMLGLEKVLNTHGLVKQAIVAPIKRENRYTALQAYIVAENLRMHADEISGELSFNNIKNWQTIYENINQGGVDSNTAKSSIFNTAGWNNSYTGARFSEEEMEEWVSAIAARILAFKPQKVLEIGCGLGLLFFKIVSHCQSYVGTDFSKNALNFIKATEKALAKDKNIALLHKEAIDFQGLPKDFDTIILNSVVQYFPSINYLTEVIEKSIEAIDDFGQIIIGDVRNLDNINQFYESLLLYQHPELKDKQLLQFHIQDKFNREKELLISPKYFYFLANKYVKISSVEIFAKNGKHDNEMKRFRYDVVLHINKTGRQYLPKPSEMASLFEESNYSYTNSPIEAVYLKMVEEQIYKLVKANFPNYTNISSIFFIDSIPITQNSKVDRAIFYKAYGILNKESSLPKTPTEKKIAKIWQQLLNVKQVNITDSFSELGGDSLMAISVINLIKKRFDVNLTLEDLYILQTIYQIAQKLDIVIKKKLKAKRLYMTNVFFDIPPENMEKFYPVIDAVPASIYWKDRDGRYIGCNQYVVDMAGKKNRGEIIGKTDFELPWRDSAETLRKIDLHVMNTGDIYETEETSILPNHRETIFLTIKKPFYGLNGNIMGLIGISIDIADRKKAEELRIKHETAEKVIGFAKLMAGSMAHEIRTPLTIIGSRVDTLKMTFEELKLNNEAKKAFLSEYRTIKRTIDDAMHTVKDMLLKLRSFAIGKLPEVDYRELSISADIERFLSSFPFQKGERELIKVIPSEGFFYFGDAILTDHVIGNLVKNARDAIKSNRGKGDITIELKTNEKFNQLIVRDTATGIPKDFLAKIFDQFETKKTMSGGTGLGLAFCKMVMESYGGSITCNSELGKYTEFVLNFLKIKHTKSG